jgi:alpha-methylacyl-CoA racemase
VPRFSRTPAGTPGCIAAPGQHTRAILESVGYSAEAIDALLAAGVAEQA